MTASSPPVRSIARPWSTIHNRTLGLVNADGRPVSITVQITLRGDDAPSTVAKLVAAVGAIADAELSVTPGHPGVPITHQPQPGSPDHAAPATTHACAPLRILAAEHAVLLDGQRLRLPRREYDLLVFLSTHPRQVFTRTQLLRTVWGYEFDATGRTVDVHVRRLRQKLAGRGPTIATVRGVGYRLDDPERVQVVTLP